VAIANALHPEGRLTSRQSFWAVLVNSLRMRTNCYFRASDRNSDIAIRFSDHDFLKRSNKLAIARRFHAVTLTFDPLILNVWCRSGATWSDCVPNL